MRLSFSPARLLARIARIRLVATVTAGAPTAAQKIAIPRVEPMPALPADYRLRDWDRVAAAYDSLVFDRTRTGPYFPLVALYGGTINYPEHGAFGIEMSVDGRRAVNGIVVDYRVGSPGNRPPRVRALVATDSTLARGESVTLDCTPGDAGAAVPRVLIVR